MNGNRQDASVAQQDTVVRGRESLRVAFLTDIVTPYMVAVFRELSARCELTVIFCSLTGTRAMPWSSMRLDFAHRVVGGRAIRRATPDAADIYPSPRILRELLASRCDVVISGGFSFPSLYAAIYRRASRRRLLIHSDGTRGSEIGIGRGQQLTRQLLSRLSDGAIGNSREATQRFTELGFDPVFEAPHSTDIEQFLEVGRTRAYGTSVGLRLITAGRLIPRKGLDRLLRAVACARQQGATVDLTIVGTGQDERKLRELAAELGLDDVRWVGFVEQGQLPALFAQADAFAFPTLDDPFGIVLLEAAASGLALLASPHGGATGDLVADRRHGFVVEPDDTEGFAKAIAELARDPNLRERTGRAVYALARERTPAHTADAYLSAARAVWL
jgi:glycosyltransferase involved in cell wall biosynthesis